MRIDQRERPMQGCLSQLKVRRVMECLCCQCLCCCPCCPCLGGGKTCGEPCLDFSVFDDYPCQRFINIIFVVLGFLLALFFVVFIVKMAFYLATLPAQ